MSSYKTIILDPGHGKIINGVYPTPGKRSPKWPDGSQLFEGEFNHDVASRVETRLSKLGIPYVNLASNTEDKPLTERTSEANRIKSSVLISIHSNAGGGEGFEVYTSVGETKSDKFATMMMEEFEMEFPTIRTRKDFSDGDSDKEVNYWMTYRTVMPSILCEFFFMDNKHECYEYLMSDNGRERVANCLVETIKRIVKYK